MSGFWVKLAEINVVTVRDREKVSEIKTGLLKKMNTKHKWER